MAFSAWNLQKQYRNHPLLGCESYARLLSLHCTPVPSESSTSLVIYLYCLEDKVGFSILFHMKLLWLLVGWSETPVDGRSDKPILPTTIDVATVPIDAELLAPFTKGDGTCPGVWILKLDLHLNIAQLATDDSVELARYWWQTVTAHHHRCIVHV